MFSDPRSASVSVMVNRFRLIFLSGHRAEIAQSIFDLPRGSDGDEEAKGDLTTEESEDGGLELLLQLRLLLLVLKGD